MVAGVFMPPGWNDDSGIQEAKGVTPQRLYQVKRAPKALYFFYHDFKDIASLDERKDIARVAAEFDAEAIDEHTSPHAKSRSYASPYSNRVHNNSNREALSSTSPMMVRQQTGVIDALLPHRRRAFGLGQSLRNAEQTRMFRMALDTASEIYSKYLVPGQSLSDVADWPIYYFAGAVDGKESSIVLHNQYCHMLYQVDTSSSRVGGLYHARKPRDDLNLLVYVPFDQNFMDHTPVFCKNCKRYVNDGDSAVPLLIRLQNDEDFWSRHALPVKWRREQHDIAGTTLPAWPLSYTSGDTAPQDAMLTADIWRGMLKSSNEEDAVQDQSTLIDEAKAFPPALMGQSNTHSFESSSVERVRPITRSRSVQGDANTLLERWDLKKAASFLVFAKLA